MYLHHTTIPVPKNMQYSSGNRLIMSLFGQKNGQNRSEMKILWRFEEDQGKFLVQSAQPPVFYAPGMESQEVNIQAPVTGTEVEFRITINSVRRKTGRSDGHITHRQCSQYPRSDDPFDSEAIDFVRGRLSRFFTAESIQIDYQYHRVVDGKMRTRLDTVEGIATVSDSEKLYLALIGGVGKSKSFGSGLLTIDPL